MPNRDAFVTLCEGEDLDLGDGLSGNNVEVPVGRGGTRNLRHQEMAHTLYVRAADRTRGDGRNPNGLLLPHNGQLAMEFTESVGE